MEVPSKNELINAPPRSHGLLNKNPSTDMGYCNMNYWPRKLQSYPNKTGWRHCSSLSTWTWPYCWRRHMLWPQVKQTSSWKLPLHCLVFTVSTGICRLLGKSHQHTHRPSPSPAACEPGKKSPTLRIVVWLFGSSRPLHKRKLMPGLWACSGALD